MKTKGRILIKISSLLFILYGAASLLAIALSLFSADAAEEYGFAERLSSPLPALSVVFAVLVPLLFVSAGLLGMMRADTPNRAKPCLFLGVAIFLVVLIDAVCAACTGMISGVAEAGSYILSFVIPALYLIGAWRNWKQPKPDGK